MNEAQTRSRTQEPPPAVGAGPRAAQGAWLPFDRRKISQRRVLKQESSSPPSPATHTVSARSPPARPASSCSCVWHPRVLTARDVGRGRRAAAPTGSPETSCCGTSPQQHATRVSASPGGRVGPTCPVCGCALSPPPTHWTRDWAPPSPPTRAGAALVPPACLTRAREDGGGAATPRGRGPESVPGSGGAGRS